MSNFREQLFQQFASQGIAESIGAFKTQYQPKKENRFNVDGITYEISPVRLHPTGLEFEISSKIPQEEIVDRNDFETYFDAIKEALADDTRHPVAMDMENIVHDVDGEELKERDYVRLRYQYSFEEVCNNEAIGAEVARFQKDPSARPLPEVANVNTLTGKVVLLCIEDLFQREATLRMTRLIEANQQVRQTFHQQGKAVSA